MSKQRKKRDKKYTGADAADAKPVVTRVQAVNRNPASQWWHDHKRSMKPLLISVGVVIIFGYLIFELIRAVAR